MCVCVCVCVRACVCWEGGGKYTLFAKLNEGVIVDDLYTPVEKYVERKGIAQ